MEDRWQVTDSLNPYLLEQFIQLIEKKSGIVFDQIKKNDLKNDLEIRMRQCGVNSFNNYLQMLKQNEDAKELAELINLITINETFFFRIPQHFQLIKTRVVPEIIARKKEPRISVWSCGCSSGEEVYSILITLKEIPQLDGYQLEVIGTDINEEMLQLGRKGVYAGRTLQTVPEIYLHKYFEPARGSYRIKDFLKKESRFFYLNLAEDFSSFFQQKFYLIFFRNVMIYFDRELSRKIIARFENLLFPWGCLFLGPSENLWEINNSFQLQLAADCFYYKKFDQHSENKISEKKIPAEKAVPARKTLTINDYQRLQVLTIQRQQKQLDKFISFEERLKILIEELQLLVDGGDYSGAEKKINQLKIIAPDNPQIALFDLLLLANQQNPQIKARAEQYKKKWPLCAEIYFVLARYFLEKGDLSAAEQCLQKVIFLDQKYLAARWLLIKCYQLKADLLAAKREARNFLDQFQRKEYRALNYNLEYDFFPERVAAELIRSYFRSGL